MGARTNAAAIRVAEQRRRLDESIEALDARMRRDVRGVGAGIAESASALGERMMRQAEELPGAEAMREQTARHPLSALLTGFGAGVALGVTGDALMPDLGGRDARRSSRTRRDESREAGSSGSILGALTGGMLSTVAGPLGDELRTMLHEAVTGFLGDRRADQGQPEGHASKGEQGEVPRAA